MAREDVPSRPSDARAEARLTEIDYHKKLNRWVAVFYTPVFIIFAFLNYRLANFFQTFVFALLAVNAIVAVAWGYRIEDVKKLIQLKYITSAIAFGLVGISLLTGVFSDFLYMFIPWIFAYPFAAMLFFGPRTGLLSALGFCLVMSGAVIMVETPPMNDTHRQMFKLSTVFALFAIFCIAWMSERIRVRVQRSLVEAQKEAEIAEKRQRHANLELQGEIELRIRSEKNLAQSEVRYRALFEESAVSLWEEDWSQVKHFLDELPQEAADDLSGYFKANPKALESCLSLIKVTAVNRAALKLYEADTAAVLLKNFSKILPTGAIDYFAERIVMLYEKGRYSAETTARTLKGRTLHLLVSSTIPAGFEESWKRIFTSVYDVTERMILEEEKKRMDQQMQYGRQIQAVATLAGGIAHQYNNALAIIAGNLDLIRFNPGSETRSDHYIQSLQKAVDRMSRLTDQLLAYAQGGKYRPQAFSANDLIRETLNSEKINVPASIHVAMDLDPHVSMSSGDVTQIKMVIEAIVSNAIESMNGNGKVYISTGNMTSGADNSVPQNLPRGKYAYIRVDDMGIGMDEQTCQRIFEPFFTTKYFGRGLGMAAAFGIVKNHDGLITVQSEPNKGTRITIYLPVLDPGALVDRTQNAA
jgi:signal transduction histidine kinase